MSDERKKAGVWPWLALLIGLLVAYPLSIGPVACCFHHGWLPERMQQPLSWFYLPLLYLHDSGPDPIARLLDRYGELWISP